MLDKLLGSKCRAISTTSPGSDDAIRLLESRETTGAIGNKDFGWVGPYGVQFFRPQKGKRNSVAAQRSTNYWGNKRHAIVGKGR